MEMEERLGKIKKAMFGLLAVCILLMVLLAFNMWEVGKYREIGEGDYIKTVQCEQWCDEVLAEMGGYAPVFDINVTQIDTK